MQHDEAGGLVSLINPSLTKRSPRKTVVRSGWLRGNSLCTPTYRAHAQFGFIVLSALHARQSVESGVLRCRTRFLFHVVGWLRHDRFHKKAEKHWRYEIIFAEGATTK